MMDGFLTIGRWRGAPVRIHWTAPLGAVFFGRFQWVPAFWAGFLLLVLFHEIGHAILVRATGQRVLSMDITCIGGSCRWMGRASSLQRALIAWGGLWAQIVLGASTLAVVRTIGMPSTPFSMQLYDVFTTTNAWLILLNLIPVPPLDGAEAWLLFTQLWRRRPGRTAPGPMGSVGDYLDLERSQAAQEAAGEADPALAAEARELFQRLTEEIRRERREKANPSDQKKST
jgi:hypothetical protein